MTGVVSVVGVTPVNATPNAARLAITLRPRDVRKTPVTAIIARLQREVAGIPGVTIYFQPVQDIQISTRVEPRAVPVHADRRRCRRRQPVGGPARRAQCSNRRCCAMSPPRRRITACAPWIIVDREKAGAARHLDAGVNDTLNDAFGQRQISTIYGQANQYRVILEATPQYQQRSFLAVQALHAGLRHRRASSQSTSTAQNATPLSTSAAASEPRRCRSRAFARLSTPPRRWSIAHQEQFPAVTISFNLAPGAALSDARAGHRNAERDIGMPSSVIGSYSGDAAEFAKSLAGEPWLILAAVITIYIVLGVLYESFIHPLTILSTLPSAGVGALLALMLFGQDLSVIALIGIVLLMGIVKKNAIMMIDFALEAERGRACRRATRSCRLRCCASARS